MTNKEIIAVVQAAERGEVIEFRKRKRTMDAWFIASPPLWEFGECDYRVKPRPLEGWLNEYPTGGTSALYPTKEIADAKADHDRIRCVHVREVEE